MQGAAGVRVRQTAGDGRGDLVVEIHLERGEFITQRAALAAHAEFDVDRMLGVELLIEAGHDRLRVERRRKRLVDAAV